MGEIVMSAYINIPKIESRFNFSDKRNKVIEMPNHNDARVFKRYYDTGELLLRGEAIGSKLHGRGIVFYKNGNIKCLMQYKDHKLNGIVQGYYLHGALALEVDFKMGKAIAGAYYNKNGKKAIMKQAQLDRKTKENL